MKSLRLLAVLALSATLASADDFFVHDGDRIVFLGDSITQQRLYTTYIEAYVLTRHPEWKLTFRNTGWGGDTAWLRQRSHPDENKLFAAKDAELRALVEKSVGDGLARDVLPLRPTVVTIKFGMNDHSYQAFRPDIFRAYEASQTELVHVLKTNGARVALLTPQPIEERRADPDQDIRNLSLRKFADGLRAVAQTNGASFVDQFDPYLAIMMSQRATNAQAFIGGGDAVHPGPAGHTIMAWAILKSLGATPLVSSAEIVCGWWNRARNQQNCRVTNIKRAGGVLTFDRLDRALPFPIDPRAEAALKLAPIVADLNVCLLKVTGLKAGDYTVSVDGVPVGTVSQAELAQGWNLAAIKSPLRDQAQEVLQLVFKKNEVFFNRWRNVQLNPSRQAELPALDQQIAELEGKIDAARIPKVHRFEVKPIGGPAA